MTKIKYVPHIDYEDNFVGILYANNSECVFGVIYPDCTKNIEHSLMFDTLDECEDFCLKNKDFTPFEYVVKEEVSFEH